MLSTAFSPPGDILRALGTRAKAARLQHNLSRKSLAAKSGVKESSLKRFETTGQVSLASLVQLLVADAVLAERAVPTISSLSQLPRQRGRV
jgi:transcriptional regulator with XRE-family HTH domain